MIELTKIKFRQLGRTGIEVFPLGFGGIPIQRLTKEEAVEVIHQAIERGVNFIDTARLYTDSEEKIGVALEGIDKKIYLATKSPADSKEEILADVENSLVNLGIDKIDIYQLHGVNDEETFEKRMGEGGALEGLKQAQKEGKIDYIGVTGHSTEILVKAIKTGEFDTVQFAYNFIENDCEEELIGYCQENNIGMIGMKPLAGGRIDDASITLKYVLNREGVVPIPGIETIEEIKENVEITKGSWEFTPEEKERVEEFKEKLGDEFCRRCQYCQPCPEEIPISMVVRAQSFIDRMPAEAIKDKNGWIYSSFQKAKNCTECGECIESCPYDLPIPELIKENREIMDEFCTENDK